MRSRERGGGGVGDGTDVHPSIPAASQNDEITLDTVQNTLVARLRTLLMFNIYSNRVPNTHDAVAVAPLSSESAAAGR